MSQVSGNVLKVLLSTCYQSYKYLRITLPEFLNYKRLEESCGYFIAWQNLLFLLIMVVLRSQFDFIGNVCLNFKMVYGQLGSTKVQQLHNGTTVTLDVIQTYSKIRVPSYTRQQAVVRPGAVAVAMAGIDEGNYHGDVAVRQL